MSKRCNATVTNSACFTRFLDLTRQKCQIFKKLKIAKVKLTPNKSCFTFGVISYVTISKPKCQQYELTAFSNIVKLVYILFKCNIKNNKTLSKILGNKLLPSFKENPKHYPQPYFI